MQGEILVAEIASGIADENSQLACTPEVRFQLASVSKQFTAAAILILADQGTLSVGDPVSRWIDVPSGWGAATIHHLLTHTAGLPHWWDLVPKIDLSAHVEPGEELALFRQAPLRSPPGERWFYSSPGYVLLAHIVQNAADQPYAAFLNAHLFEPLGMASTFAGSSSGRQRVARGHMNGTPVASFELDIVNMGAGDLWSTAGDIGRWDSALAAGSILSDVSRRAMLQDQAGSSLDIGAGTDTDDMDSLITIDGYGYGWFIGTALGRPITFHPGDNAGFGSLNAWFPDEDLRVIVLSNEETTDVEGVAVELLTSLTA